jgi:hypothetical protein
MMIEAVTAVEPTKPLELAHNRQFQRQTGKTAGKHRAEQNVF